MWLVPLSPPIRVPHLPQNSLVVTDLTGGHLALMVRLEQYADLVTKFILERTP